MKTRFGFLTLAKKSDYQKAIGLALSLKMASPGIPISIVCNETVAALAGDYFDAVIKERNDITGFKHKIFLDQYSPYQKTLFLDADILVFKDVLPVIKLWNGCAYTARGRYCRSGISSFGLDVKTVLSKTGATRFVDISGAGHAYFEKPQCFQFFDLARNISNNYSEYVSSGRFADEDAAGIAMTLLNLPPQEIFGFLGMPWHARKGTLEMDIRVQTCRYVDEVHGNVEPYLMHFPRKGFPFLYARELSRLFKVNDVRIQGIWRRALLQKLITDLWWPMIKIVKLKKLGKTWRTE